MPLILLNPSLQRGPAAHDDLLACDGRSLLAHQERDERRHLLFRDWLRVDSADRDLYERTKRDLATRAWPDMNGYADAKSDGERWRWMLAQTVELNAARKNEVPDLTANRSMIDDTRPFLVNAGTKWRWTGNVGGADLLRYATASAPTLVRRVARVRTLHAMNGPNLTDVVYADAYPYDTATFTSATTKTAKANKTGAKLLAHCDDSLIREVLVKSLK